MRKLARITVYCASSSNIAQKYFDHADQLSDIFVRQNIEMVYGGGSVGLMGRLADRILRHKGKVTGIIPDFMKQLEWAHPEVENMIIVKDMHERKQLFLVDIDAVIALPGGCGTFEELLEVITWKRLGIFNKPIIILNTDGYYDPLAQMLNRSVDEGFMKKEHAVMWTFVNDPEDIISAITEAYNNLD
jgi:uncharacterized protein (TIGR00730 family)